MEGLLPNVLLSCRTGTSRRLRPSVAWSQTSERDSCRRSLTSLAKVKERSEVCSSSRVMQRERQESRSNLRNYTQIFYVSRTALAVSWPSPSLNSTLPPFTGIRNHLIRYQHSSSRVPSSASPSPSSSSLSDETKETAAAAATASSKSNPIISQERPATEPIVQLPSSPSSASSSADDSSSSTTSTSTTTVASTEPKKTTSILQKLTPSALVAEEGQTSSIRKLMELARPEKKPLTYAIGLLLISSTVSMLVPLTIGKLIDFFSSSHVDTFMGLSFPVAATLLAFTFAVGALANTGRAILMRLSGQRIVARVREGSYLNTLRQEPEFADKGAGDIVSRLGIDTGIVGDSVTSNLSDGLRAIISAVVGVAAMVMISAKLTGLMLAVVPPVSIGAVIYGRYLRKLSNQTQEALGEMSKVAEEKLNAFKTVAAFNAQPIEAKLFNAKVDGVFQLARKEAIASGIFFGGTGLTGNLTMLCLLGYGGHLVSKGEISVGDLTSLLIYTGYVGGSVSGLTGFWSGLMKGVGAGSRVFHLLDRESAIPLTVGKVCPKERIGVIKLENVHFRYPSRKEVAVLDGVDLEIKVGTSVAIVGPSGSGKSSVQALLTRFYDPDVGKVTFDGEDIREYTPESWRARIGVVPQDPILFTGTVHENIAYGLPDATREDVEIAAKQANCDFVWTLPQGFDTPIGRASLSGGQKQRIAVARALVRKPSILLLDEATSALDSGSEAALNSSIDAVMRQSTITVIIVAHRLSSIARAQRVVVLEGGKITEQGTYREVSRQEGSRFRTLMAAQLLLEKSQSDPVEDEAEEGEKKV